MLRVFIPDALADHAAGEQQVELSANSLGDLVRELEIMFPGIGPRITDGDRLVSWLSLVINGELAGRSFLIPIPPNSEIHFIPAIAGG
jgi:molybdopterin converting factor small subunit